MPGEDLLDELLADLFIGAVDLTLQATIALSTVTIARLDKESPPDVHRDNGELLIPFFRYDFARQATGGGSFALDHRVEAGYGPVGLLFEKFSSFPQQPVNSWSFQRHLFLYRISPDKRFEIDLGFGQTVFTGMPPGNTIMSTFSLPIKVRLAETLKLEIIPSWYNGLNDREVALHAGMRYGTFKVGYRRTGDASTSVSGPFAGLSVNY